MGLTGPIENIPVAELVIVEKGAMPATPPIIIEDGNRSQGPRPMPEIPLPDGGVAMTLKATPAMQLL